MENEQVVNENNQELKYEKFDSEEGFVEGEHDVSQMRTMRFKDVILNGLLGDFDDQGKYVISDSVMEDLVALEKKIDAHTPNGIEARAFVGDKVLFFNLTPPVSLENGNAYCYLQVLEEISRVGGYYVDTQTTVVATYEYIDDDFFEDHARAVFNFKEFKADETVPAQLVPDALAVRFAYVEAMYDYAREPLDKLEEAYFNKRLQIISDSPELAVILAEFVAKRNKLENFFIKGEHKYFFLNQILDDILSSEMGKKALENSPAKDALLDVDKKFFDLSQKVETKVREDKRIKEKQKDATFENLDLGGKKQVKPQPKGVSKGQVKYSGQDLKYKNTNKFKGQDKKKGNKKDSKKKDDGLSHQIPPAQTEQIAQADKTKGYGEFGFNIDSIQQSR